MNWDEIFKDYIEVKNDEKKIYSFCDKNENWIPELQHIFLHNTESEMFILLDLKNNLIDLFSLYDIKINDNGVIDDDLYQLLLKKIISNWEDSILRFINFEWDNEIKRKYLKYNITLLIFCFREKIGNKKDLNETNSIIKEERSTSVCRKIFIFDEKNELNYLPFYFETINNNSSDESIILENELNQKIHEVKEYLDKLSKIEVKENNDSN